MALMTYAPRVSIFDEFNKIFNGINTYNSSKIYNSIWQPAYDISEDNKNYYLSFDLPGTRKKDVDISISNDILTISGSRESNSRHSEDFSRINNQYGEFEKSFHLPENTDQSEVNAKMDSGVLILTLKKAKEVLNDIKKISIK
jgi:HSP20 family protein